MKKLIAIIILSTLAGNGFSQGVKLIKQSLSANGFSVRMHTQVIVSQTIAQPSLTNAFSNEKIVLLQGFEHVNNAVVSETEDRTDIALFPNPCRGRLAIHHLPDEDLLKIKIYDLKGVLASEHHVSPDAKSATEIDVSALASGTYTLVLAGSHKKFRKIVVIL